MIKMKKSLSALIFKCNKISFFALILIDIFVFVSTTIAETILEKQYNSYCNPDDYKYYFSNQSEVPIQTCNVLDCPFKFLEVSQDYIDFNFLIPSNYKYSVIGMDIEYNGISGIDVRFLDESQNEQTIYKSEEKLNKPIGYRQGFGNCQVGSDVFKVLQMSFWVEYNSIQRLKFRFYQSTAASLIAIRSIRLWVNCAVNCKTCLSSTECETCMTGFKTNVVQAPAGTEKCEITFQCDSHCAQCYFDGSTRICTRCEPEYHIVVSGNQTSCVQNVALQNTTCSQDEYINEQGTCSSYSIELYYVLSMSTSMEHMTTSQLYYKCPAGSAVFAQINFNYDLFYCRTAPGCGAFEPQTLRCTYCISPYYLSSTSDQCLLCQSDFCQNCFSGTDQNCISCYYGYNLSLQRNYCIPNCNFGEYYNFELKVCQVCIGEIVNNGDEQICQCPQTQKLNSSGDACECDEWRIFDANNQCQCVEGRVPNALGKCECPSNAYYDLSKNACIECGEWMTSDANNQCQCIQGRTANAQGQCECAPNTQYDPSKSECIQNIGTSTAVLNDRVNLDGYLLILEFSNQLKTYPGFENQSVLQVSVNNGEEQSFSFEVTEVLGNQINVQLNPKETFKGKQVSLTLIDKPFITLNEIQTLTYEKDLQVFTYLSDGQKKGNQAASSISEITVISIICTIIPIAIFSNFYVLINTIDLTGFLYYLLFIDVRYPDNVLSFFGFFQNFQFPFIPSMFQSIISSDYTQEAPQKFIDNGFQPYFLSNSGQSITIVTFILGMYVVGKCFSYVKIPKVQPYLKRAMDETWEFSAFFDLLWSLYIYFLIGSLLQFTVYDSGEENYILNYTLHTVFAVIHIGCPFVITYVLVKKKNIKSDPIFKKKFATLIGGIQLFDDHSGSPKPQEIVNQSFDQEHQNLESQNQTQINPSSGVETEEKKLQGSSHTGQEQDYSMRKYYQMKTSKLYNSILYLRKLAFSLVIVFLTTVPYVQLSLITVLNICMAGYIFYIMPLETKSENIKNGIGELVLILIQGCIFMLVADDVEKSEDDRILKGWLIVGLSGFIMLWHASQMLYEMIKSLFDSIKSLICKKKGLNGSQSSKVTPFDQKAELNQEVKNQVEDLDYLERSLEVTERIHQSQLNLEHSLSNQNPETFNLTPQKIQNPEKQKDAKRSKTNLINQTSQVFS